MAKNFQATGEQRPQSGAASLLAVSHGYILPSKLEAHVDGTIPGGVGAGGFL